MSSTDHPGPSRNARLTMLLDRVPSLSVDVLRQIATESPGALPDAAACARRFYPRNSLGRAA